MDTSRHLHGNRGFLFEVPDWVPDGSLASLATRSGVGAGGLHPSLRAPAGDRQAIVPLDVWIPEGQGLTTLDPILAPLAENVEEILLRLDKAMPEANVAVCLAGQGWFSLTRADWAPLLAWLGAQQRWEPALNLDLLRDTPLADLLALVAQEGDGLPVLALAALHYSVCQDLDRLEISERYPGVILTDLWPQIQKDATQLLEARPAPSRRFVRGLLALLADDPLVAERELGAALMGGQKNADRWLALARHRALDVPRPEPAYLSTQRGEPSMELMARLSLERNNFVEEGRSPWRARLLLLMVLLGGLLLWQLNQSFQASMNTLHSATEVDE